MPIISCRFPSSKKVTYVVVGCADRGLHCGRYISLCTVSGFTDYLKYYCAKTCGFCGSSPRSAETMVASRAQASRELWLSSSR